MPFQLLLAEFVLGRGSRRLLGFVDCVGLRRFIFGLLVHCPHSRSSVVDTVRYLSGYGERVERDLARTRSTTLRSNIENLFDIERTAARHLIEVLLIESSFAGFVAFCVSLFPDCLSFIVNAPIPAVDACPLSNERMLKPVALQYCDVDHESHSSKRGFYLGSMPPRIIAAFWPACHYFWSPPLGPRPDGISYQMQGEIGPDLLRKACEFGLEGLVSKHRDRAYRAGTSPRTRSRSRTPSIRR